MSRKLLATVAAITPLAALTAVGTFALFTDSEALGGNLFNTGKIDLSLSTSTALVTVASGMMPGDSAGPSALTVSNAAGSSALRYAVSVATTNADAKHLDQALNLVVRQAESGSCTNFGGTLLYDADLAATSTTGKVIGNASSGSQTGDRALAPGGSEVLCFKVSLPTTADNTVASASTTATFTFSAEQTANN